MSKLNHSWLVIQAVDELDQVCMLQEFVDLVIEQLDKQHSPNRELKIELLLEAYQNTVGGHLQNLRDRLKEIHQVFKPDDTSTSNLDYPADYPSTSTSASASNPNGDRH